jgi:hypothetical protein
VAGVEGKKVIESTTDVVQAESSFAATASPFTPADDISTAGGVS